MDVSLRTSVASDLAL